MTTKLQQLEQRYIEEVNKAVFDSGRVGVSADERAAAKKYWRDRIRKIDLAISKAKSQEYRASIGIA